MKNTLTSLAITFLIPTIFLQPIHSRIISPMDAALVDETCKQTPNSTLCEALLRSDPRSLIAEDANALASIMVDVTQGKASESVKKINQRLLKSPERGERGVLTFCIDKYNTIMFHDLQQAAEALIIDDNKTAEGRFKHVAHEVDLCDQKFVEGGLINPIKDVNEGVRDAANVGAAIADKLL